MIVRYFSYLEPSGYGLSAIATVRALLNAGYAVEWLPLQRVGARVAATLDATLTQRGAALAADDVSLSDLLAIIQATRVNHAIRGARTAILQLTPEHFVPALEHAGSSVTRRIAYTTWEADKIPLHWMPLLRPADALVVPSSFNSKVFAQSGYPRSIHTIGHVRRHRFNEFSSTELSATRERLGIRAQDTVFYTVNRFDPRKALDQLVLAFAAAFNAQDPVVLVIKTSSDGCGPAPWYPTVKPEVEIARILSEAVSTGGLPASNRPRICVIAESHASGRHVDALHAIADCYVSLTHGEGFGMGACEATTLGTPIIMTAWSGQMDFLGPAWRGGLPFRLEAAPVWPITQPSYWSDQRWAVADQALTVERLRDFAADPAPFQHEARALQTRVCNEFSEARIAQKWREVLQ